MARNQNNNPSTDINRGDDSRATPLADGGMGRRHRRQNTAASSSTTNHTTPLPDVEKGLAESQTIRKSNARKLKPPSDEELPNDEVGHDQPTNSWSAKTTTPKKLRSSTAKEKSTKNRAPEKNFPRDPSDLTLGETNKQYDEDETVDVTQVSPLKETKEAEDEGSLESTSSHDPLYALERKCTISDGCEGLMYPIPRQKGPPMLRCAECRKICSKRTSDIKTISSSVKQKERVWVDAEELLDIAHLNDEYVYTGEPHMEHAPSPIPDVEPEPQEIYSREFNFKPNAKPERRKRRKSPAPVIEIEILREFDPEHGDLESVSGKMDVRDLHCAPCNIRFGNQTTYKLHTSTAAHEHRVKMSQMQTETREDEPLKQLSGKKSNVNVLPYDEKRIVTERKPKAQKPVPTTRAKRPLRFLYRIGEQRVKGNWKKIKDHGRTQGIPSAQMQLMGETFECLICDRLFATKAELTRHKSMDVHRDKVAERERQQEYEKEMHVANAHAEANNRRLVHVQGISGGEDLIPLDSASLPVGGELMPTVFQPQQLIPQFHQPIHHPPASPVRLTSFSFANEVPVPPLPVPRTNTVRKPELFFSTTPAWKLENRHNKPMLPADSTTLHSKRDDSMEEVMPDMAESEFLPQSVNPHSEGEEAQDQHVMLQNNDYGAIGDQGHEETTVDTLPRVGRIDTDSSTRSINLADEANLLFEDGTEEQEPCRLSNHPPPLSPNILPTEPPISPPPKLLPQTSIIQQPPPPSTHKAPVLPAGVVNMIDLDPISPFQKMKCDFCGILANNWSDIRRHYTQSHRSEFTSKSALNRHVMAQASKTTLNSNRSRLVPEGDGSVFYCPRCKLEFPDATQLEIHASEVHRGKLQLFECRKCPATCHATFENQQDYQQHIKSVHRRMFACSRCGGSFTSQRNLDRHQAVTCRIRFFHPSNDNEYGNFGFGPNVREAMILNSGLGAEDPNGDAVELVVYQCPHCPNGVFYDSQQGLQQHVDEVHQMDAEHNLFGCTECQAVFSEEGPLFTHLKEDHGKSFVCDACGSFFATVAEATRHLLDGVCKTQDEHNEEENNGEKCVGVGEGEMEVVENEELFPPPSLNTDQ